jgi:hypothetical protein
MARFFLLHACTRLGRYISLEERFVAWSAASGCGVLPASRGLSVRPSVAKSPPYLPTNATCNSTPYPPTPTRALQVARPCPTLLLSPPKQHLALISTSLPSLVLVTASLQPAVFCSGVLTALACILPSSSYTQRPFRLSVSSTPRKAALESSSA